MSDGASSGRSAIRGTLVHATAVAVGVDHDGPLAGVLIEGDSGAGKSDLALRAIEACPWRRTALVSDDGVLVRAGERGDVLATCPEPGRIGGLIEIRGLGVVPVASVEAARLSLIVRLAPGASRLPAPETAVLPGTGGIALPVLQLDPWQLSAPQKLRYGLRNAIKGER